MTVPALTAAVSRTPPRNLRDGVVRKYSLDMCACCILCLPGRKLAQTAKTCTQSAACVAKVALQQCPPSSRAGSSPAGCLSCPTCCHTPKHFVRCSASPELMTETSLVLNLLCGPITGPPAATAALPAGRQPCCSGQSACSDRSAALHSCSSRRSSSPTTRSACAADGGASWVAAE